MTLYKVFALLLLLYETGNAADLLLPAVTYRPETDLAFGGFYLKTFRFRDESEESRPSSFRLVGLASLRGQWMAQFTPEFFWNEDEYRINGEIGYYSLPDRFFGFGTETNNSVYTTFATQFPRLRIALRRQWLKKYGVGPVVEFEQRTNQFATQSSDGVGLSGARIMGLGVIFSYDERDSIFYPKAGSYYELSTLLNSELFISQYSFSRLRLDLRKYFSYSFLDSVIAIQHWMQWTLGDVPFTSLATLGGSRIHRGYWEGRFRDRIAWSTQVENRVTVWKKLGAAVFGSVGSVSSKFDQLTRKLILSGGFGLRYQLDDKDKINGRLDFAWGSDSFGFYLQFGEAF